MKSAENISQIKSANSTQTKQLTKKRPSRVMKEVVDEFAGYASVDEETVIEQAEVSPKNPKKNKGSPEKSEEIRESSEERRGRRTKSKPRKKSTDPTEKDTSPTKSDKKQAAAKEMEVAEDVDQIMAFLKQTEPTNAKTNEEKKENSNENGNFNTERWTRP
jgi:hypothetical protein